MLLTVVVILILAAVALFLAIRLRPGWFAPLLKLLMRNETLRARASQKMAREMKDHPEQLQELITGELGSGPQAEQVSKMLSTKSSSEMAELFDKAHSGQTLSLEDLSAQRKPRAKDVNKRRAANRRARQARKKQRR